MANALKCIFVSDRERLIMLAFHAAGVQVKMQEVSVVRVCWSKSLLMFGRKAFGEARNSLSFSKMWERGGAGIWKILSTFASKIIEAKFDEN